MPSLCDFKVQCRSFGNILFGVCGYWEHFLYVLNHCRAARHCTGSSLEMTHTHTRASLFWKHVVTLSSLLPGLPLYFYLFPGQPFILEIPELSTAPVSSVCVCVWVCLCCHRQRKTDGTSALLYFLQKTQNFHFLQFYIVFIFVAFWGLVGVHGHSRTVKVTNCSIFKNLTVVLSLF